MTEIEILGLQLTRYSFRGFVLHSLVFKRHFMNELRMLQTIETLHEGGGLKSRLESLYGFRPPSLTNLHININRIIVMECAENSTEISYKSHTT